MMTYLDIFLIIFILLFIILVVWSRIMGQRIYDTVMEIKEIMEGMKK